MDWKKLLPLIGIILLCYILLRTDRRAVLQIFLSLNPLLLGLSFLAIFPVLFLENVEWQILLRRQKIHVSFWYSLKNLFIGYFYGLATPGGVGGYLRAWYLKEKSQSALPKCVSNIITLNTLDYLTLMLLGVVGAFFYGERYSYLLFTILVVLILVFVFLLFFLKKNVSQPVFTRIVRSRIFHAVRPMMKEPFESFYEDLPGFRDVLLPFFLSLLGWSLSFSEFYVIARFFSISVGFLPVFFFITLGTVITSLPLSIYGLGMREAVLLALFSVFPVIPANVISLSLFWFVITWLFPSILGGLFTLTEVSSASKILKEKKESV